MVHLPLVFSAWCLPAGLLYGIGGIAGLPESSREVCAPSHALSYPLWLSFLHVVCGSHFLGPCHCDGPAWLVSSSQRGGSSASRPGCLLRGGGRLPWCSSGESSSKSWFGWIASSPSWHAASFLLLGDPRDRKRAHVRFRAWIFTTSGHKPPCPPPDLKKKHSPASRALPSSPREFAPAGFQASPSTEVSKKCSETVGHHNRRRQWTEVSQQEKHNRQRGITSLYVRRSFYMSPRKVHRFFLPCNYLCSLTLALSFARAVVWSCLPTARECAPPVGGAKNNLCKRTRRQGFTPERKMQPSGTKHIRIMKLSITHQCLQIAGYCPIMLWSFNSIKCCNQGVQESVIHRT